MRKTLTISKGCEYYSLYVVIQDNEYNVYTNTIWCTSLSMKDDCIISKVGEEIVAVLNENAYDDIIYR